MWDTHDIYSPGHARSRVTSDAERDGRWPYGSTVYLVTVGSTLLWALIVLGLVAVL